MAVPTPALLGVAFVLLLGCGPDSVADPGSEAPSTDGPILTTFDRLTLAPGERSAFGAAVVGATGRLTSNGLVFEPPSASIARVTAARGRAQVQAVAAGRTWVVVRSAAAVDSVEVVVQ
jgi:hypothetical protein